MEGLVPCILAPFVWFYLPDEPETAGFLSKHEKEFIINRLALETGSGRGRVTNTDKIGVRHVVAAFKEWKIWCAWVMFWANTIGVYGYDNARGVISNGWTDEIVDSLPQSRPLLRVLDIRRPPRNY